MFHGWCDMPGCVIGVIGIGGSMTKPIPAPHRSRNNNSFKKNPGNEKSETLSLSHSCSVPS